LETLRLKPDQVAQAAAFIKAGQLVAFPTETVYGLGADATNPTAVKQVYAAKGRPSDNPLIVTVSGPEQVAQYAAGITPKVQALFDRFWPGPLTLVLPVKPGTLPKEVTGGLRTAAFRNPADKLTRELIEQAGVPMVGPSANTSGKPSPTTADHVLHDLTGKIAAVLDDGQTKVGVESTIVDMSVVPPVILRPGAVSIHDLEPIIGKVLINSHKVGANEVPKAPGMKYKHYAPNAQVVIVRDPADFAKAIDWAEGKGPVGLLATDAVLEKQDAVRFKSQYSLGDDVDSATHRLFAGLRYFDLNPEIKIILAQGFTPDGLGLAYMNRLEKAAGLQYFD
jgi:L-threonylcarbamoyladenylate synthase